jgi:hypothetical protein
MSAPNRYSSSTCQARVLRIFDEEGAHHG